MAVGCVLLSGLLAVLLAACFLLGLSVALEVRFFGAKVGLRVLLEYQALSLNWKILCCLLVLWRSHLQSPEAWQEWQKNPGKQPMIQEDII